MGATLEDLAGAEVLVVSVAGGLEGSVDLEAGAAVAVAARAIGDPIVGWGRTCHQTHLAK